MTNRRRRPAARFRASDFVIHSSFVIRHFQIIRHFPGMNLTLKVWRQKDGASAGRFETYEAKDVLPDMSFLEMLDVVNEGLMARGEEPIAFDSDCREGICGTCSLVINGIAHGGRRGAATCQLHLRHFQDGDTITIEPWRARAFPVL